MIDSTKKTRIGLEDHPKLRECLSAPICGEPRTAFCYVHPAKTKDFEKYVKTKLKKICKLYKSRDLIKKGYYGLGKPNPDLYDRVSDYTLIMRKNYNLKDGLLGKKSEFNESDHGGTSYDEMMVPLIVFKG